MTTSKWPGDFFEKHTPDQNKNTNADAQYEWFYQVLSLLKLEDKLNLRIGVESVVYNVEETESIP